MGTQRHAGVNAYNGDISTINRFVDSITSWTRAAYSYCIRPWSKLTSFHLWRNGTIRSRSKFAQKRGVREARMTTEYGWYEPYRVALLETDWTKMQERIQAAESAMHERQRILSEDHGGTPDERQAIADAVSGLNFLRREVADWRCRQLPSGTSIQPD
jgi:hypothetical protein